MGKHPKRSWLPKETLSYFVLRNQLFIRLIYFPLFTSFFWILPNFNLFISVCIYSLLFRTFVQLFLVWLMFFICVFLLLLLRSVVTNCFFVCFDSKMWSCTKMWTNQFPQKCCVENEAKLILKTVSMLAFCPKENLSYILKICLKWLWSDSVYHRICFEWLRLARFAIRVLKIVKLLRTMSRTAIWSHGNGLCAETETHLESSNLKWSNLH